MRINLNDPSDFTLENVKKLIETEDDSVNTQFRVTDEGMLHLSRDYGNMNLDGIPFRIETNIAGNDYVGQSAADDEKWVQRVYNVFKENWPNPKSSYLDTF